MQRFLRGEIDADVGFLGCAVLGHGDVDDVAVI